MVQIKFTFFWVTPPPKNRTLLQNATFICSFFPLKKTHKTVNFICSQECYFSHKCKLYLFRLLTRKHALQFIQFMAVHGRYTSYLIRYFCVHRLFRNIMHGFMDYFIVKFAGSWIWLYSNSWVHTFLIYSQKNFTKNK